MSEITKLRLETDLNSISRLETQITLQDLKNQENEFSHELNQLKRRADEGNLPLTRLLTVI
jgi:hypothetical protein